MNIKKTVVYFLRSVRSIRTIRIAEVDGYRGVQLYGVNEVGDSINAVQIAVGITALLLLFRNERDSRWWRYPRTLSKIAISRAKKRCDREATNELYEMNVRTTPSVKETPGRYRVARRRYVVGVFHADLDPCGPSSGKHRKRGDKKICKRKTSAEKERGEKM